MMKLSDEDKKQIMDGFIKFLHAFLMRNIKRESG